MKSLPHRQATTNSRVHGWAAAKSHPRAPEPQSAAPAPSALLCTRQLHALGNRPSLYQIFGLLERLPVITTERYQHLTYLEQLYMRSQPERLPHPQFVLRRYQLVLHLANRHPDYPLFCRWRELMQWLNNPLRLQKRCWREFLGQSRPEVPEEVIECIFFYVYNL